MSGWIVADERLPDDGECVLIALSDGEVWTGFMDGDGWLSVEGTAPAESVTHWMPLPEPPK